MWTRRRGPPRPSPWWPAPRTAEIDAGIADVTAALGDRVFLDADRDGVQDPGETGVAGVSVTLFDDTGAIAGTAVTDTDGLYLFDGLSPGIYHVAFSPADGMDFTTRDAGEDSLDSDVDAAGVTGAIELGPNETDLSVDAGLVMLDPENCFLVPEIGLLGVNSEIQPSFVATSNNGVTSYDAASDVFSVLAIPTFGLTDSFQFLNLGVSPRLVVNFEVDEAGDLVGGVDGDDFLLFNDTDGDNRFDDGETILLSAEVEAFGHDGSAASTDLYDGLFRVTGGDVATEFSEIIAFSWSSEFSGFRRRVRRRFLGRGEGSVREHGDRVHRPSLRRRRRGGSRIGASAAALSTAAAVISGGPPPAQPNREGTRQ